MLAGRVAVVTGAGRGIGRATAHLMASLGARVLVNDYGVTRDGENPDGGPAAIVAAEIRQAGGEAAADTNSVATWEGAGAIMANCLQHFGRIDILVNNAGIYIPKLLHQVTEAEFDKTIAVHLKGAFACTQAALPTMIQQRYGRIINITSRAGLKGTPGHAHYGAAKAAVMGLTLVAYRELAQYGITVNAIQPGALTRMSDPPADVQQLMSAWGFPPAGAAGRCEPDDVAAVIAFLASEAAGDISGQIVGISGEQLSVIAPPLPVQAQRREGGWTAEGVAVALPELLRSAHSLNGG